MKVGDVVRINLPEMRSYQEEMDEFGIIISTEMRSLAQAFPVQTVTEVLKRRPWMEDDQLQIELDKGGEFYWPVVILDKVDHIQVVDLPAQAKDVMDSVCSAICRETKSRGI